MLISSHFNLGTVWKYDPFVIQVKVRKMPLSPVAQADHVQKTTKYCRLLIIWKYKLYLIVFG